MNFTGINKCIARDIMCNSLKYSIHTLYLNILSINDTFGILLHLFGINVIYKMSKTEDKRKKLIFTYIFNKSLDQLKIFRSIKDCYTYHI